jgi:cytochrome b involved in lipid metabolism
MSDETRIFAREEVAAHNKDGDLWIIVNDTVFDLSKFQNEHPGGKRSLSPPCFVP